MARQALKRRESRNIAFSRPSYVCNLNCLFGKISKKREKNLTTWPSCLLVWFEWQWRRKEQAGGREAGGREGEGEEAKGGAR